MYKKHRKKVQNPNKSNFAQFFATTLEHLCSFRRIFFLIFEKIFLWDLLAFFSKFECRCSQNAIFSDILHKVKLIVFPLAGYNSPFESYFFNCLFVTGYCAYVHNGYIYIETAYVISFISKKKTTLQFFCRTRYQKYLLSDN